MPPEADSGAQRRVANSHDRIAPSAAPARRWPRCRGHRGTPCDHAPERIPLRGPLRDPRGAGVGQLRSRLPGGPALHGPVGRDQAPEPTRGGGRVHGSRGRALPPRDPDLRRSLAHEHRAADRLGRDAGRPALRGLRVHTRRDAGADALARWGARRTGVRAADDPGARRARLRPREGHRPQGSQAREPHAERHGARRNALVLDFGLDGMAEGRRRVAWRGRP
jgi:hypothetical protein